MDNSRFWGRRTSHGGCARHVWALPLFFLMAGCAGAQSLTITTSPFMPTGIVGTPYSLTLTASGGVSPYSWSLTPGLRRLHHHGPHGGFLRRCGHDTPEGCYVPLAVSVNSVMSDYTTISVSASGGACGDSFGLSASDSGTLGSTGQFRLGTVLLLRIAVPGSGILDGMEAKFDRYDSAAALKMLSVGDNVRHSEIGYPPLGSCNTIAGPMDLSDANKALDGPRDVNRAIAIDSGPLYYTLSGPYGTQHVTDATSILGGGIPPFTGTYGPEYLVPGTYTLDKDGGSLNIPSFHATLVLPQMIAWTNLAGINTISRLQNLTLTWSGGDPAREFVVISGVSGNPSTGSSGAFLCTERASAGQFTVPANVLSSLPASGWGALARGTTGPFGALTVGSSAILGSTRFPAQGLDAAFFGYEMFTSSLVNFQ